MTYTIYFPANWDKKDVQDYLGYTFLDFELHRITSKDGQYVVIIDLKNTVYLPL